MTNTNQNKIHKSANECQTMIDVRKEVDYLDILLVELLAKRQSYMDAAARIKGSRDLVRDNARVEEVVSNVKKAAKENGLSINIAEPVWRCLIEQSIQYEFNSYDKQHS